MNDAEIVENEASLCFKVQNLQHLKARTQSLRSNQKI